MYLLPAPEIATSEFEEKRSKFIGMLTRVHTEDEARAFIARCVSRYPDARHHCHAFILHNEGAQPVERSSDDGEPSGTAGLPMLEVLRGSGVSDVAAVVVRYFGGTKLGTGGLVRAYSASVQRTLEQATIMRRHRRNLFQLELPHATAGKIEAELRATSGFDMHIDEPQYHSSGVTLTLAIDAADVPAMEAKIAAVTAGQHTTTPAGEAWTETLE